MLPIDVKHAVQTNSFVCYSLIAMINDNMNPAAYTCHTHMWDEPKCNRMNVSNQPTEQEKNRTHTRKFFSYNILMYVYSLNLCMCEWKRSKIRKKNEKKSEPAKRRLNGELCRQRDWHNVLPKAHGNFKNMLYGILVVISVCIRDYVSWYHFFFSISNVCLGYDYGIQVQIDAVAF